jgi:hypothetical protein
MGMNCCRATLSKIVRLDDTRKPESAARSSSCRSTIYSMRLNGTTLGARPPHHKVHARIRRAPHCGEAGRTRCDARQRLAGTTPAADENPLSLFLPDVFKAASQVTADAFRTLYVASLAMLNRVLPRLLLYQVQHNCIYEQRKTTVGSVHHVNTLPCST